MGWALGDSTVLRGGLSWAATGAWTARLQVAADEAPAGAAVLTLGSLALQGYVVEAGVYGGVCTVRLQGGRGALRLRVPGQHFRDGTARLIAQHLLSSTEGLQEELDPESELEARLTHWHHFGSPLSGALSELARALGISWWVTPLGLVRMGALSFPEASVEGAEILREEGERRSMVVALEDEPLMPATTYGGRALLSVDHEIWPGGWRAVGRW